MTFENQSARISTALDIANRYGGIDGGHHKMWVIDQMVRALTGCPVVVESGVDSAGVAYTYETQGASEEYRAWVQAHRDGEDGPETYDWDEGVAP